ncbi:MAG: hypothetical protein HXY39_08080 [Chloroflexi bacterium]|nr:hypothetical protein [Chloroflexota bacterium]
MADLLTFKHRTGGMRRVAHVLLLAPEAPFIAMLLALDSVAHSPISVLATSLLTISFITRMAALRLAQLALHHARWRAAEALATVALALHPWSPDALALRGAIALAMGNITESVAALRRAAHLAPQRPAIGAALSGALLELGHADEAEVIARQALELDAANAAACLHLAQAQAAMGCAPEIVEEQLRAGLARRPEPDAEVALHCALARHLAGQGRLAEAALALSAARAHLPRCSAVQQASLNQRLAELTLPGNPAIRSSHDTGGHPLSKLRG